MASRFAAAGSAIHPTVRTLPRAILFDLDDTLLRAYARADLAWERVTGELAEQLAPHDPAEIAARIQAEASVFWADPERHRIWRQRLVESRRRIVVRAFESLAADGPAPSAEVAVRVADRFSALREAEMSLHPGARETLDSLRALGVRLGLLTNGAGAPQRAKLERFDLERRFDHVQIEGEHGFGKPEPRAYLHALQRLSVTAADVWVVGDNLEWEVAAPQRLGIHAIWFDGEGRGLPPESGVRPDRTIRRLRELVPGGQ
jgi:putative hydrolase of the HAD superfamily